MQKKNTKDSQTIEDEMPLGSIYGPEDSRLVRQEHFNAIKGKPKRRTVITQGEWDKFSEQGRDMSDYVTLKEIKKALQATQKK